MWVAGNKIIPSTAPAMLAGWFGDNLLETKNARGGSAMRAIRMASEKNTHCSLSRNARAKGAP
jgi:hypothetical protein